MNNYYVEFKLNKNDSLENIKVKLLEEKKKWTNRASIPQNTDARYKAERKLQLINEAQLVFSDKYKREEYDSALEKSGENSTPAQQAPIQQEETTASPVDVAKHFYDGEDPIHALDFCKKQIDAGNNDADLYWYLALSYADLGRIEDSVSTFEKAISLYPNLARFYTNLAAVCVFNHYKVEKALEYADKAIELDPLNSYYKYNKVRCLFALGKVEEAESIISKHLEEYPTDVEFKKNVSEAYLVYGDTFYENSNTAGSYIPNAQAYKMVKTAAQKAVDMDKNEMTESALHATISRGKREFNKDNLKGIIPFWAICILIGIMEKSWQNYCVLGVGTAISVALIYYSYKPVWMLEKMQLTGKRDLANAFSRVLYVVSYAIGMFIIGIFKFIFGLFKVMGDSSKY